MVIGLDSANRAIQSFRISIVLIVSQFKSVYNSCRVKVLSSAGDTKRSSRSPLVAIRRATISGLASCWPAVVRSAPRATACAPTRCPSRSPGSAPSRSYRRSLAGLGHRTESIAGRSLGGACRGRRGRYQPTSRATCVGAWRARSYEGREHPAKPTAARKSWPRWSSMGYWITSFARCSSISGTISLSAFAAFRLMTRSNVVGCSTGRSPGRAPLRILST